MIATSAKIKLMEEQTRRRIDILMLVTIVALDERDDLVVSY